MVIRHDPRIRLYLAGDWQDITADVRSESKTTISRGRGSSATVAPPQSCTLRVDNDSLKYSSRNPLSPWFGIIGHNTPTEVMKRLVTETFSAPVVDNWGTTDTGQTWTVFGVGGSVVPADWDVALGKGTMSVPATSAYRASVLTGTLYRDVDVYCDVSVPTTNVTGGDIEPGNIYLRATSTTDWYLCRVVVTPAEAVTVTFHHSGVGQLAAPVTIDGLTHTAAQVLRVRAQAEGNTLRAKVWAAASPEPYDWSITVHDTRIEVPGWVGVRNGVAGGNTNALPWVFSVDNFSASSMRFAGELSGVDTDSDTSNKVKSAGLTASGITRRLGQGDAPVQSVMRRALLSMTPAPIAYWPCEDTAGSGQVSSGLPGGAPMVYDLATPTFGDDAVAFPCTASVITLGTANISGPIPNYTPTSGQSQIRWLMQIPSSGATNDEIILRLGTSGGTTGFWLLRYRTGGGLNLTVRDRFGADLHNADYGFGVDGLARRYSLELTQNGADVDWDISLAHSGGAGGISGTLAGQTYGRMDQAMFNVAGGLGSTTIGQISVEGRVTSVFDLSVELGAYSGERSVTRMIRLCAENDVPFSYVGDSASSMEMGAQRPDTLLKLLRQCEAADGGSMFETRGVSGIGYRTRESTYALTPTMVADCSATQLKHPFQPVEDDRDTRNDVTVERTDGGEFHSILETGRMSVLPPPNGAGRYDTRYPANVLRVGDAQQLAEWIRSVGTVDEPRYPNLGLDLDASSAAVLVTDAHDLDCDHLIRITNAGAMVGVYDNIDQVVRGYSEVIHNFGHTMAFNVSPYAPYAVAVLDSGSMRLAAESSTTSEVLDTTETGVDAANGTPTLWSTTEEPYDVLIGGERFTVTTCTGSGAQVFTVTRSVNGVVKGHATAAPIQIFSPTRLAL